MFSRFFIIRPIFASVLSIVITIGGLVSLLLLPVAQYPEIAPPTVQVACAYPGASAEVVASTVGAPIEQQVNGVEGMLYMTSQSNNDGSYGLTVTFELGTDLDMAQVLVQNRVAIALPTLPEAVRVTGVTTRKRSPDILLVVNMYSPDRVHDQLFLSNYATIFVRDELARVDGVGDVFIFGQQDYAMRVWLDPEKMAARGITADDVVAALREQNVQVAAGAIGQPPVPEGQVYQLTMTTLGRLTDADQFDDVIVKVGANGARTRLRDIAESHLGAKSQDQASALDGSPSAGIAIFQLPGSNALDTAQRIRDKMEELKTRFPQGVDYAIVYDTTPFVSESIHEVVKTLFEAFVLVAIVVLVFLQSWRSAVIPLVAVPVSLIGTFAVMAALGFSLNNLSMLGLVLAIGIVVDDAIVVVENVERWIEHGLSPIHAAFRSMQEVTVAVVAIAFGLSAVFIPTAFVSGITGQFYRQFALTIAAATLISAFNSLTLSPALAAIMLRHRDQMRDPLTRVINFSLGWFFNLFNRGFGAMTRGYTRAVAGTLRVSMLVLLLYGGLLVLTHFSLMHVPTGFIPAQDKGYLLMALQMPDAASLERTDAVMQRVSNLVRETEGVAHTVHISGYSVILGAAGSNYGTMFVVLDDFHHRQSHELYSTQIAQHLAGRLNAEVEEAAIAVFGPPPVSGVGSAGGFKVMIEDRGNLGPAALQQQVDQLVAASHTQSGIAAMFSQFRANTPQLYVDIDRDKCKRLGIPLTSVFDALQVFTGGYYVNDFNQFGRTWQVKLQASGEFRNSPEQVQLLKVRAANGAMVPLGTLAQIVETTGPAQITRHNLYTAAAINGQAAPGVSSGDAINIVEGMADNELAPSMAYEWTELTLQEILAGNTALLIFPLCILFVFLTHSAEYESWALPLAIILIVPMSLLCALAGIYWWGLENDIFTQIGFIVLAGLACKNAVLIVEFAKQQQEQGKRAREAVIEACRLRLRPILMTSFAFILGVVPLMLSRGAGAEMRVTLGVCVFFGMLGVTAFGLFLTPVFFLTLRQVTRRTGPIEHVEHKHGPMPPVARPPGVDHA